MNDTRQEPIDNGSQPAAGTTIGIQSLVTNNSSSGFITASISPSSASWCNPVTFFITDTTGKKLVHIKIAQPSGPDTFYPLADVDTTTAGSGNVQYTWDTSKSLPSGLQKQPGVYLVRVFHADWSDYVKLQIQMSQGNMVNGLCPTPIASCSAPQGFCNNICTNLNEDQQNCGQCGVVCQSGQTCQNGACSGPVTPTCIQGLTYCTGLGCRNLMTDTGNCGQCGVVCQSGQTCQNGACSGPVTPSCIQGLTYCTGLGCRNLMTDTGNCGQCSRTCSAGQICQNGGCVWSCPQGQMSCVLETGMLPICIDVMSNSAHCGNCNTRCASNQTCINGLCTSNVQKQFQVVTTSGVYRKYI